MCFLDYGNIFNKTANKIASFVVEIMAKTQLTVPKKLRWVLLASGYYKSKYDQEKNA